MKLHIVPTWLFFIFFISCNTKETTLTPEKFNEQVVSMEQSLDEPLLKTEAEIKVRSTRGDFAGMAKSARAMEDSIQVRINAINKLAPVGKGGEDFKTVCLRYFSFLKNIYTDYRTVAEAKDDNARTEALNKMNTTLNAQTQVMQNMQAAQLKYAQDNNFTIEQ